MVKVKKSDTSKVVRISQNSYDGLLFIKSQLETKRHSFQSFSDVVDYLVDLWSKKYDRRKR